MSSISIVRPDATSSEYSNCSYIRAESEPLPLSAFGPGALPYMMRDGLQRSTNYWARTARICTKHLAACAVPGTTVESGWNAFSAGADMLAEMTKIRGARPFGITEAIVDGKPVSVSENVVIRAPFCDVIHFARDVPPQVQAAQPRMLLVTPLSGHRATLLKGTVDRLVNETDLYVIAWNDASDVPFNYRLDLRTYINEVGNAIDGTKPDAAIAVCQGGGPLAVTLAYMEQNGHKNPPSSAFFLGSPIDPAAAETVVTKLAAEHEIGWFDQFIETVPLYRKGAGRQVMPGARQLLNFVSMNWQLHSQKTQKAYFDSLKKNDQEAARAVMAHNEFYDEYERVGDLPAEFFRDTIQKLFQERQLANGTFVHNGQPVDLGRIIQTNIVTVEGGKDDITAPGQCRKLLDLCCGLEGDQKKNILVPNVGHYGLFSGRTWENETAPTLIKIATRAMHTRRAENDSPYPA